MPEIGLFSTNLANTAPSIGGLLDDKIEEGLSYTISSHLYTTGSLVSTQRCTPYAPSCILRERRPRDMHTERGKRQRCYRDRGVRSIFATAPTRAACSLPL